MIVYLLRICWGSVGDIIICKSSIIEQKTVDWYSFPDVHFILDKMNIFKFKFEILQKLLKITLHI